MGIRDLFRKSNEAVKVSPEYRMITTSSDSYYGFDGRLYRSDLIRASIKPAASAVGKLTAKHIRRDSKGDVEINPQLYMKMLLKEPNPYMTGQDLQERMATDLMLNGNAFALIVRDPQGYPSQLYPLNPQTVKIETEKGMCLTFTLRGGKTLTVNYGDLIHVKQDTETSFVLGGSPLPAVMELMEMAKTVDRGLINAVKNSGAIRWLLKFLTPLSPKDLKINVQNFVDNYMAYDTGTMGAAGVDSKADAIQVQPNNYVPGADIQSHIYERVKNFFHINDEIIQSRANEEQWNAYYEQVVEPIALKLANEFTRKLFTRRERGFGNEILFEAGNLEHVSIDKRINLGVQMVDRGALSPNEWRAIMNLAPIEGGDVYVRRLDTAVVDDDKEDNDDNSN